MKENTRDLLNRIYEPIVNKSKEIAALLMKRQSTYNMTRGFFNGHYHKNAKEEYRADIYPIAVISMMGLCDIEIDFDSISITSKISRNEAERFNWRVMSGVSFEVYGVEEYLNDYGSNRNPAEIRKKILSSVEKEFFVSIYLPVIARVDEVAELITALQMNHFYY